MDAVAKIGTVLMGVGGILVGILGIMFLFAAGAVTGWYQGLAFLVLGVGLLLWAIAALFGAGTATAHAPAGGATRQRAGV